MDTRTDNMAGVQAEEVKACCAAVYASDWARQLLGEPFHPGGLALTKRLGMLLGLGPGKRLLDVAAGKGASAIFLAQQFGCAVIGVEYSNDSGREATRTAEAAGVTHLVCFKQGDAERLAFADGQFDAVICECAFCTFPNKSAAAGEFARVLRPGGSIGLADLTRSGEVPAELQGLLAWIACIADALSTDEYAHYLGEAGLTVDRIEPHDDALTTLVHDMRTKLFAAELLQRCAETLSHAPELIARKAACDQRIASIMGSIFSNTAVVKLKHINLPSLDFEQAKALARAAAGAVKDRRFGYAVMTATKPG